MTVTRRRAVSGAPTIPVAADVRAVELRTVEGKAGLVAGRRAVLAIDAGVDRREGAAVAAAARAFGRPSVLLALTHAHSDHAHGSSAFADGEILAHELAAEALAAELPSDDHRSTPVVQPTIRFRGDVSIDLGRRQVQLLDTPGHSPGAISVYVPDAGVLFGGDTLVTCIPPNFSDGSGVVLEATLRSLAGLDARILVPGHGPVLVGRAAVRGWITRVADYLASLRDFVGQRIDRAEPSAIVAEAERAPFVSALLPESAGLADRHRDNVSCFVRELSRGRHDADR